MKPVAAVTLLALAAGSAAPVFAQSFPSKPIRIVTQFSAGASGDNALRALAPVLDRGFGQPIVIENKAGGGGMVAAETVAGAAPDGYTILSASSGTIVTRQYLTKIMSVNPEKAFIPITQLSESLTVVVGYPAVPGANLKDVFDRAKTAGQKLFYGTSGIGSEHHLSGEQLRLLTGAPLVHVPYKASAAAMLDVVGERLTLTFAIYSVAVPHIKNGKLKVLAVVRDHRSKQLPDVPTVPELMPGFEEPPSWSGLFAPAGLPAPILKRLSGEFVRGLKSPEVRAYYEAGGQEVVASTPEEFAASIKRQRALVARLVKSAGIEVK